MSLPFPTSVPDSATLSQLLRTRRDYLVGQQDVLILWPGQFHFILPELFQKHMAAFLWRESAIRLVLLYARELKLSNALADTLAMILWYMDVVFNCSLFEFQATAATSNDCHSMTFNQYLKIEYWARRHEPKFVNASPIMADPNLISDCGEGVYIIIMLPGLISSILFEIGTCTSMPWGLSGVERNISSFSATMTTRSIQQRFCYLR